MADAKIRVPTSDPYPPDPSADPKFDVFWSGVVALWAGGMLEAVGVMAYFFGSPIFGVPIIFVATCIVLFAIIRMALAPMYEAILRELRARR